MEKTRLTLRLPSQLAEQATVVADQQGLTMNAFVVQAVRNWVSYQGKRMGPALPSSLVLAPSRTATVLKVGSNQPCPCGSGQKYKRCHGKPGAA